MSSKVLTYDDRDTSTLTYSGAWHLAGTWSTSSSASNTLSSTNDLNAYVSFRFPVAATSFTYYGMRRSRGGSYGVCIDCDPKSGSSSFNWVNGFDVSDNGQNAPVALFSVSFPQAGIHTITMRNQADSRGTPAGNSQLTLDRIVLQVPVQVKTSTTTSKTTSTTTTTPAAIITSTTTKAVDVTTTSSKSLASSNTSSSTTATVTGTSSTSSTSTSSKTETTSINTTTSNDSPLASGTAGVLGGISESISTSTSESDASLGVATSIGVEPTPDPKSSHVGTTVGAVIGSIFAIACLLLVVIWLRRCQRAKSRPQTSVPSRPLPPPANFVDPFVDSAPTAAALPLERSSESEKSTAPNTSGMSRNSLGSMEKRSHQPGQSSQSETSSSSLYPASTASYGRRESDAGRLSAYREEEEDMPPPEYSQLFRTSIR